MGEDSQLLSFPLQAEVKVSWQPIFLFDESLAILGQSQSDVNDAGSNTIIFKYLAFKLCTKRIKNVFKPITKFKVKKQNPQDRLARIIGFNFVY